YKQEFAFAILNVANDFHCHIVSPLFFFLFFLLFLVLILIGPQHFSLGLRHRFRWLLRICARLMARRNFSPTVGRTNPEFSLIIFNSCLLLHVIASFFSHRNKRWRGSAIGVGSHSESFLFERWRKMSASRRFLTQGRWVISSGALPEDE